MAIGLATLIPLAALPFYRVDIPSDMNSLLLGLWVVTGFGHVMSTIWFGLDEDYKPIIGANRLRMMTSLAILPVMMAALALSAPTILGWIFAAYWVWQAHHYNRQNYGILALAATHEQIGPLPRQIGHILHLTTCAGAIIMASMPAIYPEGVTTPAIFELADRASWQVVAVLFLLAAAGLVFHLLATNERVRRSPAVVVFLLLALLFYLPGIWSTSPVTAFWPYAMAHGAQYLIIMGVTAGRSRRGLAGLLLFMLIAYTLGIVGYAMVGVPWGAFYTGIVMWHFLADARLWRLRDPAIRAITVRRFGFLFRPEGADPPGPRSGTAGAATPGPSLAR